jgi:predicted transcriptional regulator
MFRDVLSLLGRMGLRDSESRIYMVCLASEQGLFTHEIVRQTKIKRSTVDVMVKRLLQQNFLTKIKVGRRFQYQAQKPEALLYRQEELLGEWRDVVPFLKKIHAPQTKTEVLFFEGADGFRQVHEDILLHLKFVDPEKRELFSLSSADDFMKLFPDLEKAFINKRLKHKISYRALATETKHTRKIWASDLKQLRTTKFIADKLDFRGDISIYADNVAIYSTTKPLGGVVIRNPALASSLRSLLNFVWDLVP